MWVKKIKPPHECCLPVIYTSETTFGSIWQCDECGKRWMVVDNGVAGTGWKHIRDLFAKKDEK